MSTTSGVPFSVFKGHLKSLDISKLDQLQSLAVSRACSRFFAEPVTASGPGRASRQELLSVLTEMPDLRWPLPFRYRRFAGGASLARNRYFSICDEAGSDSLTLVNELKTYTHHASSGEVLFVDSLQPNLGAVCSKNDVPMPQLPRHCIAIRFFHEDCYPSPFVEEAVKEGFIDSEASTWVTVGYRVKEETIASTIDLREPSTQNWIYEQLSTGIPGIVYAYSATKHVTNTLRVSGHETCSDLDFGPENTPGLIVPEYPHWDGTTEFGPPNFVGLLRFLLFQGTGGSPLCDTIALWLRRLGAQALVYPSARNDVECHMESGFLSRSSGWNLVDYRDAPTPKSCSAAIFDPESWAVKRGQPSHITWIRSGRFAGSWIVRGQAQAVEDLFSGLQEEERRRRLLKAAGPPAV